MTHTSTEQERAEFEAAWMAMTGATKPPKRHADGDYSSPAAYSAFRWWQAARRAPAVPQGWKLVQIELLERIQESLGSFLSDQGWSQSDMDTADALAGLLAVTRQPPAAAPVELPEPAAWILGYQTMVGDVGWKLSLSQSGAGICQRLKGEEYEKRLYTEQQVRVLLAEVSAPAQEGWCDGCNPDNCVGCGPAAPAQVQPEPNKEQS